MPAEMDPSWFNTNTDFNSDFNKAALQGVDVKKATGGLSALSGVDLNDPQSVSNAVGNSIKSGNLEQANALIGVNGASAFSKNVLPLIQQHFAAAQGGGQPAPAAAPGGTPGAQAAQGGGQSPQAPQGQPDPQHMAQTMSMANDAVGQLLALPQDQRPAAAAQMSKQFEDRGVPSAAFDSATSDLSDAALKEKQAYYDAHAQHFDAHAQGQTPDATALPQQAGDPWYKSVSNDPFLNDPMIVGGLKKYLGIDMEPALARAAQLALPGISKDQEQSHAFGISEATAAGKVGADLATEAGKTVIKNANEMKDYYIEGSPNPTSLPVSKALQLSNSGVNLSMVPPPEASEAAKARGTFDETLHEIKGQDANGQAVTRTMLGKDIKAAVSMGASPTQLGMTPSDQNLKWKDLGIVSLGDAVKAAATHIQDYQKDDFNNHQMLALANTVGNTGPYTKTLSAIAGDLAPILGNGAAREYASNVPLLAQTLSNYTRSQFDGTLPRIKKEFEVLTNGQPTTTSPQDQIKLDAVLNIAKRNFDNEMNQYFVNNSDNLPQHSLQSAQIAWDANQGKKSILAYALPDLQKLTINGKPAMEGPFNKPDGHSYGIFMPHTNQERSFLIK